jgi:hypothetical protein
MLEVRDRHRGSVVARTPPGRGGEIQLTDALADLAAGGTVHGVLFDGLRYDTGDKADHLRTVVRLACARADLGPEFTAWLREFVAGLPGAGAAGRAAPGRVRGSRDGTSCHAGRRSGWEARTTMARRAATRQTAASVIHTVS